jgi:hypothetical protein
MPAKDLSIKNNHKHAQNKKETVDLAEKDGENTAQGVTAT